MTWTDRRARRREPIDVPVTVQVSAGGRALTGRSADLSTAGVFVVSSEVLPVGERVDLVLDPAEGGVILLAGDVVHAASGRGIGIAFHRPGAIAAERLEALTARAEKPRAASAVIRGDRAPTRRR